MRTKPAELGLCAFVLNGARSRLVRQITLWEDGYRVARLPEAHSSVHRALDEHPEITDRAMIKRRNILALLLTGGLVSCGEAPGVSPGSAVDAVAGVVETVASSITGKGHLGFDTGIYPGDETMRVWRATAPYKWVGYYLPAPCRRDASWAGKRQTLSAMGWGLAVLYVGQQTWEGVPERTAAADTAPRPIVC